MRVHLYQDVLLGVDIHLQHARPVEGAVQQHHETLVGDVRAGRGDVATVLGQLATMVLAVEQFKLSANLWVGHCILSDGLQGDH